MNNANAWRLLPCCDVVLRRWLDEWVVTDTTSGNTYLLNLDAGIVLHLLQAGPATPAELATALQDNGRGSEALHQYLNALTELDLIEPCPL